MAKFKRRITPKHIMRGHSSEVRALVSYLRKVIKKTAPRSHEAAYPVWHAIGYRNKRVGYFCGIFPYRDSVRVYFEYGRYLPDPAKILKGHGKRTRYVLIKKLRDLKLRPFKATIRAAIHRPKQMRLSRRR